MPNVQKRPRGAKAAPRPPRPIAPVITIPTTWARLFYALADLHQILADKGGSDCIARYWAARRTIRQIRGSRLAHDGQPFGEDAICRAGWIIYELTPSAEVIDLAAYRRARG